MTVAASSMITMSGRGTITSRATVSPNSMMLSISSRSSCSITSSSAAALDDAEQLLLADERTLLEALARQQHVGQPDQPAADEAQRRERHQPVGEPRAVSQRRPLRRAGPPTSSASPRRRTKNTTTLSDDADDDALRAEQAVGEQDVVSDACTICSTVTVTSSGLMNRSGCATRRSSAARATWCRWSSAIACGLDPRDAVQPRLGDRQHEEQHDATARTMIASEHPARRRCCTRSSVVVLLTEAGRRRAVPVVGLEQRHAHAPASTAVSAGSA